MALSAKEWEELYKKAEAKAQEKEDVYRALAKKQIANQFKNNNVLEGVAYGAKTGINQVQSGFESAGLGLQHTVADVLGMDEKANELAIALKKSAQEQAKRQAKINSQYDTNFGGIAKAASDVTAGAVGMLPTIGAAVITPQGKVAAAGKLAQVGAKALRALPSAGVMGAQATGAGINQALNEGANINQAKAYGLGSAVKEVATELPFAGIAKVPGLVNVGQKLAGNKMASGVINAATEGAEEAVAEAIDPQLQRWTYNPNADNASLDDMLYSALIGAGTAGLINSGFAGAGKAANMALGTAKNKKMLPTAPKNAQNQGIFHQSAQNGAGQAQTSQTTKYLPRPDKTAQNQIIEVEKIRKQMEKEQAELLKQKNALWAQKEQMEQAERDNLYREIKNLEETINLLRGTQSSAFDDALFNAMDEYTAPQQKEKLSFDMPMSERTLDNVSNPKVKAYQSTHPEVKAFFREQAEIMLNDLNNMIDGGREYGIDPETRNVNVVRSQTRATSSQIERLLNAGMTKAQIRDGLERIIRDNGAENTANAKKVETTLDDALANGYQSMQGPIPKNLDYVYNNADIKKMQNAYGKLNSEESFANAAVPAGLINELQYLDDRITERQQLIDAYSELLPDMSVYETMTAEELHNEMAKLENASQYAPNEIAGEMMARHRYLELLEEGRVNEFIENENMKTHVANLEKQLADKKLSFELPRASDDIKKIQKKLDEIEAKQAGISPFGKATQREDGTIDLQATADANPAATMEVLETERDKYTDKITGYKVLPRAPKNPTVQENRTVAENATITEDDEYEDADRSGIDSGLLDYLEEITNHGGVDVRIVQGMPDDRNGRYRNGIIELNVNRVTDQKTLDWLMGHELYHSIGKTEEAKNIQGYALKYFQTINPNITGDILVQMKQDEYAETGITLSKEEAWEEIGAEFMEIAVKDTSLMDIICKEQPTLAQQIFEWIQNALQKLTGKTQNDAAAQQAAILEKARNQYAMGLRGAKYNGRNTDGSAMYNIVRTTDGKPVVKIETDIFAGMKPGEKPQNIVADYIRGHIGDVYTIIESGQKVYIGKDLPGEFTHSKSTQRMVKNGKWDEVNAKNQSFQNVGELIEIATNRQWEKNTKEKHKVDAKYGWYHYETRFALPNGDVYTADLLIRNDADGKKYLYDEISIKKDSTALASTHKGSAIQADESAIERSHYLLSDDSIPQTEQEINTNRTMNSVNSKTRLQEMVEQYGSIPAGENPYGTNRDVQIPQQVDDDTKVSRFGRTAAEASQINDDVEGRLEQDILAGRLSYTPSSNQEQMARANRAIAQSGWEEQHENFRKKYRSGEMMTADDIALGEQLILEAQASGDTTAAVELIADVAALGTELGRAVQALSLLKRMTPQGKVMALKRLEQRVNANLAKKGNKFKNKPLSEIQAGNVHPANNQNVSPEVATQQNLGEDFLQVKIPDELLTEMLQARGSEQQAEVWDKCVQAMADQTQATLADKINAWRYLAMLSNPKTHIRNLVGNSVMLGVSGIKRGIQAQLENRLLTAGEERYAEFNRNVPQEYFDFAEWSWENSGKERAKAGGGRYNDAIGQIEQNKRIFETEWIENARLAVNGPEGILEGTDMAFKKKTYIDTLARYMYVNGLSPSVLQNKAGNASYEKGEEFALKEAYKGTFQEASKVANLLSQMEHLNTGNKLVDGGAKLLMGGALPFKKTPINILKRGVEYSPVGLLNGLYKMRHDVETGKFTKAEAIDSIASGLTGTGIMVLGYFMASMGWITAGAGEDDDRKQWYDQSMGSQNYALVLPNGGTATIDWLAPSVMPLMAGAELFNQMKKENPASENSSAVTATLEAISKVANPALEMSMLQGVTDALQSYNSGTTGVLSDLITSTATSYGGQFIPSPVGALARTLDDTVRSSYAPKDSAITKTGEKFLRQQVNKLPVVSMANEASIDVWGEERKREGGNIIGRAFNNFINPATYSSNKKTDLDRKLDELYESTGESNVLPRGIDGNITADGQKYILSPQEYTQYAQRKGQKSRQYVNAFVNSSEYNSVDDTTKAQIINSLYDLANYEAKKAMLKGRKVKVDYSDEQYEKVLDSGVKPYEYYATKERFGGKWTNYEKALEYSQAADKIGLSDNKFVSIYNSMKAIEGKGEKANRIAYLEQQKKSGAITNEQYWYMRIQFAGTPSKADKAACPYGWMLE